MKGWTAYKASRLQGHCEQSDRLNPHGLWRHLHLRESPCGEPVWPLIVLQHEGWKGAPELGRGVGRHCWSGSLGPGRGLPCFWGYPT